jgi:membrane associated rhomboid family serine protease
MFLFLPLGTTRPHWRTPYATYGLILANAAVFAFQLSDPEALPPGYVPAHPGLLAWVLSMFMHGGIMHLAGNMLFLWLFATLTEDVFGAWLMLGIYVASNLGATLFHSLVGGLFAPGSLDVPVVGASGAIAGIMGLSAICFTQTRVRIWYLVWFMIYYFRTDVFEIAAPVALGLWVAWEVFQGLIGTASEAAGMAGGGVAHWAHVGGFAVGLAVAYGFRLRQRVVRTDLVEGHDAPESSHQAYSSAGELERVTRETPDDAEAWYALGRARELTGLRDRAAEAHARAVGLFLRQRKEDEAVRAYRAFKEYGNPLALPPDVRFPLACALSERGMNEDALRFFRDVGQASVPSEQTETALVRAGEIARALPGHEAEAVDCYQKLLRDYAYGPWRSLAMERLAALRRAGVQSPTSGPPGAKTDDPAIRTLDQASE